MKLLVVRPSNGPTTEILELLRLASFPALNGSNLCATRRLVHNAHFVRAGSERNARPCHLGNPPQLSNPRILTDHHALAQVIHERRTHLCRGVNRIRTGKWLQERIRFLAVSAGNRPSRRPRVKRCSRMSRSHQAIPHLPLPRGLAGPPP